MNKQLALFLASLITSLACGKTIRSAKPQDVLESNNNSAPISRNLQDECGLSLNIGCKVRRISEDGSVLGGQDCDNFVPPSVDLEPCKQTPLTTTFLYNGGDCSQSDNVDALGFSCRDGLVDSPPSQDGDQSFIVVTNAYKSDPSIYFKDWVTVGSNFEVGNGELMEQGVWIRIYDAEDMLNLEQEVIYQPSLCSDGLELLNRFGASQIVEYTNEDQGVVSPFAAYRFETELEIEVVPTGRHGETALESFQLMTDFSGFVDLTDEVKGTLSSQWITLPIEVDLTSNESHSLLYQISASQSGSEDACTGVGFEKFAIGA